MWLCPRLASAARTVGEAAADPGEASPSPLRGQSKDRGSVWGCCTRTLKPQEAAARRGCLGECVCV